MISPMTIRIMTAKRMFIFSMLHWRAKGVVPQIKTTPIKAKNIVIVLNPVAKYIFKKKAQGGNPEPW
jgi:hypothetical protein